MEDYVENRHLEKVYYHIGKYIVNFNSVQNRVEFNINNYTRKYIRSADARFAGNIFGRRGENGYFEDFLKIATQIIKESKHIYYKREETALLRELEEIHFQLFYQHEFRNILTHGCWDYWDTVHSQVEVSKKIHHSNKLGVIYPTIKVKEVIVRTENLKKLRSRIDVLFEKAQFGEHLNDRKIIKTKWYKNKQRIFQRRCYEFDQLLKLKNLGPDTVWRLVAIGVRSPRSLKNKGAVKVYTDLINQGTAKNKRLFYSLKGSLENKDWKEYDDQEYLTYLKNIKRCVSSN